MIKDFGMWMKRMRKKKRWSQVRLAEKVGVHYNTIIRWESGTQFPTLDKAEEIAQIFGFSLMMTEEIT